MEQCLSTSFAGTQELNLLFIEYEKLCDDPGLVWKALSSFASLPSELPTGFVIRKAPYHETDLMKFDDKTKDEAYGIHSELVSRSKDFLS